MNKYLENEVKQLLKFAPVSRDNYGDPERFWSTAKRLMASDTYLIVSLGRVLPNWHRQKSLKYIISTLLKAKELIKTQATEMDLKRAYIPKGDTWRPLGVPTLPWRIYLHM